MELPSQTHLILGNLLGYQSQLCPLTQVDFTKKKMLIGVSLIMYLCKHIAKCSFISSFNIKSKVQLCNKRRNRLLMWIWMALACMFLSCLWQLASSSNEVVRCFGDKRITFLASLLPNLMYAVHCSAMNLALTLASVFSSSSQCSSHIAIQAWNLIVGGFSSRESSLHTDHFMVMKVKYISILPMHRAFLC